MWALKRTGPQTTAFGRAKQIKGLTKMCLASAGGQSDTRRQAGVKITDVRLLRSGEKRQMEPHLHTRTHTFPTTFYR